jgi:4-hydroxybenzoate polyprenyltransferase
MSNTRKPDDEKPMTIAACGIFSGALLAVLFTAGNLFHMGLWLSILAVIAIAGCAYSWYIVIMRMKDPKYDKWRLLCMLFAIAAICVIMGHRGSWLNQVKSNSKTEQVAP